MSYWNKKENVQKKEAGYGHFSYSLLGEAQGCTNGCCGGISYYTSTEYTPAAVHDDHEGFVVLSGKGMAKIGDEEFLLEKETAFLAPIGTSHQMRTLNEEEPLVLFWFHAQP